MKGMQMTKPNGLLMEIVTELEKCGVSRESYCLHDTVDAEAFESLIESGENIEVTFTVEGVELSVMKDREGTTVEVVD